MASDPIVDELHRLRAAQMARFNFDFDAFYRDLKEQERRFSEPLQSPPESLPSKRLRPCALVLTGTCGSGKTTVSTLLANRAGWVRVSEDDIWREHFGKDRGAFGSADHRRKRERVHSVVFDACRVALEAGQNIVIDATVHEAPPEAYLEYRDFFEAHGIAWKLRVLHPRLEIAVARDASRSSGRLGADRVASLHAKFTGAVFGAEWFVDSSEETPEETKTRLLEDCSLERP